MKKKILNVINVLLFLVVLSACVGASSVLLRRKDSGAKYADFFDKAAQEQIDVLFLGSSHVINGYNPVVLYNEYGITSYNMGGHGSVMQSTYWELIEALNYVKPQYVVVDAFLLQKDEHYLDVIEENADDDDSNTNLDQLHLNMDAWPTDATKIAAINDLIQDPAMKQEFLFDLTIYHDRWKELTADDFAALKGKSDRNKLFGAEMRYGIELKPKTYPDPPSGAELEGDTVGKEYLAKIIEECQARDIGVIVTFLPCSATTEDKLAANSAEYICADYGVPFFNMLGEEVVDLTTDMNDTGHLNAMGATKVTDYIGEVLSVNCGLEDHRGDPDYEDWQDKADAFYAGLDERAIESDNLYQQLNYLSAGNLSYIVYFSEDSEAYTDDTIQKIIFGVTKTADFKSTDGPYILVRDKSMGKDRVYQARDQGTLTGVKTSMGTLNYQPVERLFRILNTDEDPDTNYLYDDEHFEYDIQILIYDDETGEIITHKYYKSYGNDYEQ